MTEAHHQTRIPVPMTLAALGIVYGDIGTSPLYAFKQAADSGGILSPFNRCPDQLGDKRRIKALVADQAEHVVHAVGLAPRHQRLAGEAGIAASADARLRDCTVVILVKVGDNDTSGCP
jgi:hypothetical protein